MNGAQRVIKYFAIALAIGLIVTVVTALAGAGIMVSAIVGRAHSGVSGARDVSIETLWGEHNEELPENLEIEVTMANVRVRKGEEFRIEADDDAFECSWEGKRLKISEKDSGWPWNDVWWRGGDNELTVYLPEEVTFDEVMLGTGVGTVDIERLEMNKMRLKLGAGKTTIGKLEAKEKTEIDGGVGLLEIYDGEVHNLDLDMGVGKMDLRMRIVGDARIDAGMGEMTLKMVGEEDDYKVVVDRGLGAVNWRGLSEGNSRGGNLIEINGGVGAINLEIVE